MNANATTREAVRACNALDALEAALSAYLSADKAKDDAFSIVRKTCPVDKNTYHYDTAHPAYQPLHDARKRLDEARGRYYAEYTATVNAAAQRGDAETFWRALDFIIDLTSAILRKTITSRLRWNRNPINPDAFNNHAFETMVTDSCGSAPLQCPHSCGSSLNRRVTKQG